MSYENSKMYAFVKLCSAYFDEIDRLEEHELPCHFETNRIPDFHKSRAAKRILEDGTAMYYGVLCDDECAIASVEISGDGDYKLIEPDGRKRTSALV